MMIFFTLLACSDSFQKPHFESPNSVQKDFTLLDHESESSFDTNLLDYTDDQISEEHQKYGACTAGIEHYSSCTYYPVPSNYFCNDDALAEADLLLSLTCEDIDRALLELPLCETTGLNCYQPPVCDSTPLSAEDYEILLSATDITTLTDIQDVSERLLEIRTVFVDRNDIRGLFASVYHPITMRAIEDIQSGEYEHQQWAENLVMNFSKRYFWNLREHLLGSEEVTESWSRYYDLHTDCSVSNLRQAASGIAVHLIVDLPYTLEEIGSSEVHYDDFERFGANLVEVTPQLVYNLQVDYNTESAEFFDGFFFGDWIDGMFGTGVTTTFMFQTIRSKAWNNGIWLQDWRRIFAEGEIYASWRTADGFLATLDAGGL